ncbi:hypothetical protein AB0I10_26080 [Streptomyces sp. NPDC050636]|uniref:hypothetical protein n=1 Tax=Streptomyces sp. NPDC050636 TaxID=3154510 RepID=UPI0034244F16
MGGAQRTGRGRGPALPAKHANLNVLGRYSIRASAPADGGLRPLRDPDAVDPADEDGASG